MNHSFVHCVRYLSAHHLLPCLLSGRLSWSHGARVQATLILLNDGPKVQSPDAGSWEMPKRSHKGFLPSGEKVQILDGRRKEKNFILRLLKSKVKQNLLSVSRIFW